MRKTNYRIAALTVIVIACLCFNVSNAQMRNFTGSNGRIIEAEFLGFDKATQIVKLRLKDGREQNVKLDLFSAESQQWIKAGGKNDGDNPFGSAGDQQPPYRSPFTNIFEAAQKGTVDDVRYFVSQGANVNSKTTMPQRGDGLWDGWLPLGIAARQSNPNIEIVKYLVSNGADVNMKNDQGWTALHEVAFNSGNMEILKYLIGQGADVNAREQKNNKTPLDLAKIKGHTEMVRYLESQAPQPFDGAESDWEWLFDGRSLNGWEGDSNVWRVNQNETALVNTGRGNLFTQKQYDNFIIQLEFQCDDRANNGLLIRVDDAAKRDVLRAMEIQIADDRNINDGNHNGSVYNALSGPKPVTRYGRGDRDWNFMELIADGQKITTYVNGMKVVDDTLPQDKPFSNVRSGRIGFMGFGGMTTLRYIRIKHIKAGEDWRTSRIAANDSREGFTPIFDGRTLNGWRGAQDKFRVENNTLINFDPGKLETIKQYQNFIMRFEFRLARETNNGVNIRKGNGNSGFEIQVADDSSFNDDHPPRDFHGAIWSVVPPRRGSLNAVGQWNTQEIIANGPQIRVVVNDQVVVDTDIRNLSGDRLPPGLQNKSGSIEFFGIRGQSDIRNIRIKELP